MEYRQGPAGQRGIENELTPGSNGQACPVADGPTVGDRKRTGFDQCRRRRYSAPLRISLPEPDLSKAKMPYVFCKVPEKSPPVTVKVRLPPAVVSIVPLPERLVMPALLPFRSRTPLTVTTPTGKAVSEPSCKVPADHGAARVGIGTIQQDLAGSGLGEAVTAAAFVDVAADRAELTRLIADRGVGEQGHGATDFRQ